MYQKILFKGTCINQSIHFSGIFRNSGILAIPQFLKKIEKKNWKKKKSNVSPKKFRKKAHQISTTFFSPKKKSRSKFHWLLGKKCVSSENSEKKYVKFLIIRLFASPKKSWNEKGPSNFWKKMCLQTIPDIFFQISTNVFVFLRLKKIRKKLRTCYRESVGLSLSNGLINMIPKKLHFLGLSIAFLFVW